MRANLFSVHTSEIDRNEIDDIGVVDHPVDKDAVLEFATIAFTVPGELGPYGTASCSSSHSSN